MLALAKQVILIITEKQKWNIIEVEASETT